MSGAAPGGKVSAPGDPAAGGVAPPPPPRGGRGRPGVLRAAAWVFGALVLAGLALRPAFGDALVITRYTGYLMPWLLALLLPGAAWAWRARHVALAVLLSTSAVAIAAAHAPLFRPRPAAGPRAAGALEVMSYNTWSRNEDERGIARVIRAEAPDLVLLQEIPAPVFERLRVALGDLYGDGPVYSAHEPDLQQAMLSRHPLEPGPPLAGKGQAQRVVVHAPAGPIVVYNVHPLRTGGWRQRYGEIARLLEEDVLRERAPVILAGDLNVNDRTELYGVLRRHLRNAHDEAGFGFGFTYPAVVPLLPGVPALPMARIDHVFFSDHLVAVRAATLGDSGGSDHRPVLAELLPR